MARKRIKKKIIEIRDEIERGLGTGIGEARAKAISEKASKAIVGGMKSQAWEDFMKTYAQGDDEHLERLCGRDEFMKENEWARELLAYLPANAMCDVLTTTFTFSNVPTAKREHLDYTLVYDDEE